MAMFRYILRKDPVRMWTKGPVKIYVKDVIYILSRPTFFFFRIDEYIYTQKQDK